MFFYREICIEFNHSQLDYYTELDAVSLGGVLKYPDEGELEIISLPQVTHSSSGYVFDSNNEFNQEKLSGIRVPSIPSNVICFKFLSRSDDIHIEYNNVLISRYPCQQV